MFELQPTAYIFIFLALIVLVYSTILFVKHFVSWLIGIIKKAGIRKIYGIELEGGSPAKRESPHSSCMHGKDIVVLLTKQAEMLDAVHTLERRVLKDQMNYVKTESTKFKGKAQSVFLRLLYNLLKSDSKTGLIEHPDYKEYTACLKDIMYDMRDLIENAFEENHYATRAEKDFQVYVSGKVGELTQEVTDFLNDAYKGEVITRELLYDENNMYLRKDFESVLTQMFWNAREIAVRTQQECDKLRKDFAKYMEGVI